MKNSCVLIALAPLLAVFLLLAACDSSGGSDEDEGPQPLLANGDFSAGFDPWTAYKETSDFTYSTESGVLTITLITPPTSGNAWDPLVQQKLSSVEKGATYEFAFSAWSDTADVMIHSHFQEAGEDADGDGKDNTVYVNEKFTLTTTKSPYSYTGVAGGSTKQAALKFNFGLVPAGSKVYIDDVMATKK